MKREASALSKTTTFHQLWEALGSKLIESLDGRLLYTQGVRGSSPLSPTTITSPVVGGPTVEVRVIRLGIAGVFL